MPDDPRPSAPLPTSRPADALVRPVPGALPQRAGTPPRPSTGEPADEARSPAEYLETPGSHRRPNGAATDVGA